MIAIFLSLTSVAITDTDGQFKLVLRNYPVVILFLMATAIFFALLYIAVDKSKIKALSKQIELRPHVNHEDFGTLLLELTSRQREVYDLIISGRTNKEIMAELFIEQSTLKSHINQVYKKLNIKNRKELKTKLMR